MTRHRKLLASYFTLAGDINPLAGTTISPFPFRDRVETAAKAGFGAFGLFDTDMLAVAEREGVVTMRSLLDDHGFARPEVELQSWPWYAPDVNPSVIDRFFACAADLRVSHVKVGGAIGPRGSVDGFTDAFAGLCDRADEAGTRIALEMVPFTNVPDLDTACAIVEGADRPNGGHVIDAWHIFRAGQSLGSVASLPAHRLFAVELDDAAAMMEGSMIDDTLRHRRYCGEGSFDLAGLIRAVDTVGYDGPFGIEILSDEHRKLPLAEAAERAFVTTRALFDRVAHHD